MTWVRFEDRFPWHRKIRKLSDAAFRLHVSGVCWSVEHGTDGTIGTDDLDLVSDVRRPVAAVRELVERGSWIETQGGWTIHDFHDYQQSAEQVRITRDKAAERQRRARDAARDKAEQQRESRRDSSVTHAGSSIPPTRPVPNQKETAGPRKRGTRLEDNWRPTAEDVAWQRDKGISDLDARRELEKFSLYWQAKSGRDATKTDWSKTWRGWLLRSAEHAPTRTAPPPEQRRVGDFSHLRASTDW